MYATDIDSIKITILLSLNIKGFLCVESLQSFSFCGIFICMMQLLRSVGYHMQARRGICILWGACDTRMLCSFQNSMVDCIDIIFKIIIIFFKIILCLHKIILNINQLLYLWKFVALRVKQK